MNANFTEALLLLFLLSLAYRLLGRQSDSTRTPSFFSGVMPIPGTAKRAHLGENLATADRHFTDAELRELDGAFAKIKIHGDRYTAVEQSRAGNRIGPRTGLFECINFTPCKTSPKPGVPRPMPWT